MRTLRGLERLLTLVVGLALAVPTLLVAQRAASAPAGQEMGFAADIQAMVAKDKLSPPPANGVLFTGSSIFRQWTTLAQDMAPLPAFNRAFGGSRTWEVNAYMDQVVLPYKPRIIVYYCGSNDVLAGESAAAIAGRFKEFEARVHKQLPATRIFYFAINRAPDKRDHWNVVDEANAQIKQFAYATKNLDYIESNTVLFGANDEPLTALYLDDGLHFHPPAYVEFTKLIRPVLIRAWADMGYSTTND